MPTKVIMSSDSPKNVKDTFVTIPSIKPNVNATRASDVTRDDTSKYFARDHC